MWPKQGVEFDVLLNISKWMIHLEVSSWQLYIHYNGQLQLPNLF